VSLLTELEIVRGWFSTKVPSLRDFLFARKPRRPEAGNREPVPGAQNLPNRSFYPKNKTGQAPQCAGFYNLADA